MTRERDEALRKYAGEVIADGDTASIKELMESLRWHVDQRIINDFGEDVWLGPCNDEDGRRIGITDCCFANAPCPHHAAVAARLIGKVAVETKP